MSARKRVAVLISGRGSNLSALLEATALPDYPAQIVGVLSNKPDALGLETAKRHDIPTAVRSLRDYPDKDSTDAAITEVLEGWNADIVCLAGFMRLLSARFTEHWLGRMINIHPSLLPSFRGLHTHEQALAAGVAIHGCTVHFVTPGMDEGPALAQAAVPVLPGDTPESLSARVLAAEHQLYPLALAALASGRIRLKAGKVIREGMAAAPAPLIWPRY